MYKTLHLSPMIPSFNIQETVTFFTDVMGFKVTLKDISYAIVCRDNLTVHILNAGKDIGQMEFYLEVDDIDRLWNNIKGKINNLKVRKPFDREYGMREFHIEIPQTNTLLFVGQAISQELLPPPDIAVV